MKGLSLLSRTNSPRRWNLAAWHSPHSLTWSWILSLDVSRPTFRPHARVYGAKHGIGPAVHIGLGTFARISANRNLNTCWQLGASLLGASLSWSRQKPIWYRDLYQRLRDERDQLTGLTWLPDSHPHKVYRPTHEPRGTLQ